MFCNSLKVLNKINQKYFKCVCNLIVTWIILFYAKCYFDTFYARICSKFHTNFLYKIKQLEKSLRILLCWNDTKFSFAVRLWLVLTFLCKAVYNCLFSYNEKSNLKFKFSHKIENSIKVEIKNFFVVSN